MQRHPQGTSSTPLHLRRSHGRHPEQPFQPSFAFSGIGSKHHRETLDLSVHLPPKSHNNRFEVLALLTSPPEPEPVEDVHIPSRYRRSRNSRGTKEAKRRRDARRSRRKMAAQMLDEQLSREIDLALSKINAFQPTTAPSIPSPASALPTTTYTPRWLIDLPPLPPSPPQLPALDFRSFGVNVNSFLEATAARPTPSPLPPRSPALSIPSWCPPLPCFTRKGIWSDGLPTFYDLSSMPEPKDSTKSLQDPNLCRELQLWRGNLDLKPKQSRFFPAVPAQPKPKVKLAPTACTLHASDTALPDVAYERSRSYADAVKKGIETQPVRTVEVGDVATDVHRSMHVREPSAANLWNILAEVSVNKTTEIVDDPYTASFEPGRSNDAYLATWQYHLDLLESGDLPAELDGREIPYVHPNSLTGHSNEASTSPYAVEHPNMYDSAVWFTPLASPPLGLNEMMMDYDIGPPLIVQSEVNSDRNTDETMPKSMQHSIILAEILPIDCVDDQQEDGEEALATSDAHFQSEQSLFSLGTPPPGVQPKAASLIDLATFLKMGHARNCWCQDCEELVSLEQMGSANAKDIGTPELLSSSARGTDTPQLVPFDRLTELDDDWMLYSSLDDQSVASDTTLVASSEIHGDDKGTKQVTTRSAPVWEDYFPCRPHATCTVETVQTRDEHVGFAESSDADWM